MLRRKFTYTIYDDDGKVIIISRNKRIAKQFAKGNENAKRSRNVRKKGRKTKKDKENANE